MEKVTVGKHVLWGLAGGLGVALLSLAFLLGRTWGHGREQAATPAQPVPHAAPEPVFPGGQAPLAAEVPGVQFAETPLPPSPAPPLVTIRPTVSEPSPAPVRGIVPESNDKERKAVAAYFQALEGLQPGNLGGDPQALAQELTQALIKGDTTGIDQLIRQSESARSRMLALVPPAPCARFHQQGLTNLEAGVKMMRSLKQALASADPAAELTQLAQVATDMQQRAQALQREELSLRQAYGLQK